MDWGLAEWMHSHQGQTCTERLTCTYFLDQRSPPPAGLKSWSPAYSPPGVGGGAGHRCWQTNGRRRDCVPDSRSHVSRWRSRSHRCILDRGQKSVTLLVPGPGGCPGVPVCP